MWSRMSDFGFDNISESYALRLLLQSHKWDGIIMEY